MIAIENLKTFLFFTFKIDQGSKISSLFFSFGSDKNFFSMHFLKCLLVFFFLGRELIFDILGSKFLQPYFPLFDPQKNFFLLHVKFPIDEHVTRSYWFWPQIPFLGSEGLFSPFWPTKVYFFLLHVKFPIGRYVTRPYWFWAQNSVFGLWGPIFAFLTPKSVYFLHL
jgi:hypothetical protein